LGQNVRLAAKLTGWKIDVRGSEKVLEEEGVSEEDHKEEVAKAAEAGADEVIEVEKSDDVEKEKKNHES
jgi:transcription antitermination factor NusA-like protein